MQKKKSSQPLTTYSAANENRRRMPKTAAEIDGWRAVFGPVKVLWVVEDGMELGTPTPEGVIASASNSVSIKRS